MVTQCFMCKSNSSNDSFVVTVSTPDGRVSTFEIDLIRPWTVASVCGCFSSLLTFRRRLSETFHW